MDSFGNCSDSGKPLGWVSPVCAVLDNLFLSDATVLRTFAHEMVSNSMEHYCRLIYLVKWGMIMIDPLLYFATVIYILHANADDMMTFV